MAARNEINDFVFAKPFEAEARQFAALDGDLKIWF
jgi:hypothetical protein